MRDGHSGGSRGGSAGRRGACSGSQARDKGQGQMMSGWVWVCRARRAADGPWEEWQWTTTTSMARGYARELSSSMADGRNSWAERRVEHWNDLLDEGGTSTAAVAICLTIQYDHGLT